MARVESITELEHIAARHWRGTEEDRLGGWLLRAADGFTGRANSVLPLGDPGVPLDGALAAVARWYRARALPPMIVIPLPLQGDSPCHQLDNHLSERTRLTRPGPAFVMVADLAAVPPAGDSPAAGGVIAPEAMPAMDDGAIVGPFVGAAIIWAIDFGEAWRTWTLLRRPSMIWKQTMPSAPTD